MSGMLSRAYSGGYPVTGSSYSTQRILLICAPRRLPRRRSHVSGQGDANRGDRLRQLEMRARAPFPTTSTIRSVTAWSAEFGQVRGPLGRSFRRRRPLSGVRLRAGPGHATLRSLGQINHRDGPPEAQGGDLRSHALDAVGSTCGWRSARHRIFMAVPNALARARRAFSAPMLGNVSKPVGTLLGHEEKSRDEPEVVTQLPKRPGGRPAPPPHPALARLPRP